MTDLSFRKRLCVDVDLSVDSDESRKQRCLWRQNAGVALVFSTSILLVVSSFESANGKVF